MADERDPDISRKYRELGAQEPPRVLDEAILAASRRAVDSHPAPLVVPAGRRRWYFPVAAAAVITLAVAVTVQVERQKPNDEFVVATAPPPQVQVEERTAAQVERKERAFSGPAAEQPKPAQKPMRAPPTFTPEPPPATPAPAPVTPAPPAAADSLDALAKSRSDNALLRDSPARATVGIRGTEFSGAPTREAAPAGAIMSYAYVSPEKALEQIAELRKQGKHEDADKALAEFRKQYPDYRLTDEMRAKVEKK